jgi:hydroxymethylbilane synthase
VNEPRILRLGTRGSALALAQAHLVASALDGRGVQHEIVTIETAGDKRAVDTSWGEGAFVTAIERALVTGEIDVAIHSAKDLPTETHPGLIVGAFLPRAEPRDALVLPAGETGSLDTLAAGTTIGTDSPRRAGFLRSRRPDLVVKPIHGNVDTRLRRLDDGAGGALLLAAAGLIRLGRADRISQLIAAEVIPPAPGQGAIAVQIRDDDEAARKIVACVDDFPTRVAVEAERAFLNATGGGCRAPIGALASVTDGRLEILGGFATVDGRAAGLDAVSGTVDERDALAENLAARLVARRSAATNARRVLVTRPQTDAGTLVARLAEQGLTAVVVPTIEVELLDQTAQLDEVLLDIASFEWGIVTSVNGARAVARAAQRLGAGLSGPRWAAVGRQTARELNASGVTDVWFPTVANADSMGGELPLIAGQRVLWARGDLADDGLAAALESRGAIVTAVAVYRTIVGPESSRALLDDAMAQGPIDAVIFTSPSAVQGLLAIASHAYEHDLRCVPAVCVGPRTALAATRGWCDTVAVATSPDPGVLSELVAELLASRQHGSESAGVVE